MQIYNQYGADQPKVIIKCLIKCIYIRYTVRRITNWKTVHGTSHYKFKPTILYLYMLLYLKYVIKLRKQFCICYI